MLSSASKARATPVSKSPAARPISKMRSRGSRSASVTARRYARRASAPRISRAHGSSSSGPLGRQTKMRWRLGVSPGTSPRYGP